MKKTLLLFKGLFSMFLLTGCGPAPDQEYQELLVEKINQYEEVTLTTDLSWLNENEREMIPILIEAARVIDEIFWLQSYGDKDELMDHITDEYARAYARINYGPWGRLEGHTAFYHGFDDKPLGANFYPHDMGRQEFEEWDYPDKTNPHTLIRRDADGDLMAVSYAEAYEELNQEAARLLREAARLSDYEPLAMYLKKRAEALTTNSYYESDRAWMQMRDNNIDFVIGPVNTGEDRKFGYKEAHSSYLLIKDLEWSRQLERFEAMLPQMQAELPVPEEYKQEKPGDDSRLFVYDALFYGGHCNAGPKMIALNLPNDPAVQQETGTRSIQIRNVMEAKFDEILLPIGEMIIHEDQKDYVTFDAFFHLTAFYEIAEGLGISQTIDGEGSVRNALREYYGIMDANSSDMIALHLLSLLHEKGEITERELHQAYVTSFASILRSSRFGTAGAHGVAAMIRFNHLKNANAFNRCGETNTYTVNFENMQKAIEEGASRIIQLMGDGNYEAGREMAARDGEMSGTLKKDIDRINESDIPVDVIFRQGTDYLDL